MTDDVVTRLVDALHVTTRAYAAALEHSDGCPYCAAQRAAVERALVAVDPDELADLVVDALDDEPDAAVAA